ncbi:hypothetical protein ACFVVU_23770 [Kitasatospora sp. NPDC057965]|uniref:hypothetical protein n=1 Tax=Kitasatospora sp. NPDC057965 TaxID=3346291 RepID=UPI0036DE8D0C
MAIFRRSTPPKSAEERSTDAANYAEMGRHDQAAGDEGATRNRIFKAVRAAKGHPDSLLDKSFFEPPTDPPGSP